jgi:hypothetical protein
MSSGSRCARRPGRAVAAHGHDAVPRRRAALPDRSGDRGGCRPGDTSSASPARRRAHELRICDWPCNWPSTRRCGPTRRGWTCRAARSSTRCRPGAVPGLHVSLGPERVRDRGRQDGARRAARVLGPRVFRRGGVRDGQGACGRRLRRAGQRAADLVARDAREPRFPAGQGAADGRRPARSSCGFARVSIPARSEHLKRNPDMTGEI